MDFLTYVKEHRTPIIKEVKSLCRIKSVFEAYDPQSDAPFGKGIQQALEHMLKLGEKDGFATKNVQNHAGHIEYGEGEEILGILAHLDVVPAEEGWTNPPFSPVVKDGKLYARGAVDDKGPLIAAYFALKFLKELDVTFHRRVRLIMGTDEETAWRGINTYFKHETMPDQGFSPDADFPLIHGEKGIYNFEFTGPFEDDALSYFKAGKRHNIVPDVAECRLDIDLEKPFRDFLKHHGYKGSVKKGVYKVHGKSAHAMSPHLGVNAAFILARFLSEHLDNRFIHFIKEQLCFDPYGEKLGIATADDTMKHLTINPAVFSYDENGASILSNIRYPKDFSLNATAKRLSAAARRYGLSYEKKFQLPLHYVDPKDPLVEGLLTSYRKITNDYETPPKTIGGGTYARALDKGVAFGPVMPEREDLQHQKDEHIYIDDLIEATAIYMEAIYSLTRRNDEKKA